jgi:hypothetical protein
MQHDLDYIYKGHEVVILHDTTGYMCDIRSDDFDGELMAGYCDLASKREAVTVANEYIDGLGVAA